MPTDDEVRGLLGRVTRYVAFVDLLGYRAIVGDEDEVQAFRRIESAYATLLVAVRRCMDDWNGLKRREDKDFVEAIGFSDCMYLACHDLQTLLCFARDLFATSYTYYPFGGGVKAGWLPYLRGGIAHGWALSLHDATLTGVEHRETFRNPVGPAVAAAYELSEVQACLSGMRCCIPKDLAVAAGAQETGSRFELASKVRLCGLDGKPKELVQTVRLFPVDPKDRKQPGEELLELDWFSAVVDGDNVDCFTPAKVSKAQFQGGACKHYDATLRHIARSVAERDDEELKKLHAQASLTSFA